MLGLTNARSIALAVTGLLLIACTEQPPASTTATGSPLAGDLRPTLVGSIAIGGDYNVASSFVTRAEVEARGLPTAAPAASTCAGYAAGLGHGSAFVAPEIHISGNPQLYLLVSVERGFTGPGIYDDRSSPGLTGVAAVTIPTSAGGIVTVYRAKNSGISTLTVEPNGSGTLSFSHWGSDEHRAENTAGYLFGTIKWTCHGAGAAGATPTPIVGSGPVLKGIVTVGGAYVLTAAFSAIAAVGSAGLLTAAPPGYTCSDYARGSSDPKRPGTITFASPELQTTGSTNVYLQATLDSGYGGPGSYDGRTAYALTGVAAIMVGTLSAGGFIDVFRSTPRSMTTLTVRPDGSGTLVFGNWYGAGSDSEISGTVDWTCRS